MHERLARDWTVESLALKIGISDRRLRDIEKGELALQSTVMAIAKALALPARELLLSSDEPRTPPPALTPGVPSEPPVAPPSPVVVMHEPTQLERLVAIERTIPPRPRVPHGGGLLDPLTARRMQAIFTAFAARAGTRLYATGRIVTHRGLADAECQLFDARRGFSSRVLLFTPIDGESGLTFTVHTRLPEHTLFLQEQDDGAFVSVVVRLVLASEEAVKTGGGFTFFQSSTPREWALVVEEAGAPLEPTEHWPRLGAAPRTAERTV